MIRKVRLPKADANIDEATIGGWMKSEGEPVKKGEPLVEIVTDKAVFEYESPFSGILLKILAPVKSVIPPHYIMALMGKVDDPVPDCREENRKLLEKHRQEMKIQESPAIYGKSGSKKKAKAKNEPKGKIRATPAAKRLARENNLDLALIKERFSATVVNEKMVAEFLEGKED